MRHYLDFEQPIADLEGKIEELRHFVGDGEVNITGEIGRLQAKAEKQVRQIYRKLTPWQKVQVARHPDRPHLSDYLHELIDGFMPLCGDRAFADDKAIIGGIGRFRNRSMVVIGNEKGGDTRARVRHSFGMARPEGYRKAVRLMRLADRFGLPILTLIDTSGAYPGVGAEERGQAEAIARSIECSLSLRVPQIAIIIGEGGSGGAVALATADRVLMLEHAIYSVISPEGCASILWRNAEEMKTAAEALRLTASDLQRLKVIDGVIPEPLGGAHRNKGETMAAVGDAIAGALGDLADISGVDLQDRRRDKFMAMGVAPAPGT